MTSVSRVPSFGKIRAVYLVNAQEVALQVEILEAEQFLEHYQAYSVFTSHNPVIKLLPHHSLSLPNPIHIHKLQGKNLLIPPHNIHLVD